MLLPIPSNTSPNEPTPILSSTIHWLAMMTSWLSLLKSVRILSNEVRPVLKVFVSTRGFGSMKYETDFFFWLNGRLIWYGLLDIK